MTDNSKLADWDDDDGQEVAKRFEKVVIFKKVFTLKELEDDVTASLDIKQDIMEGCQEIGAVTSVTLYDLEEDGVVSVKFQHKDDAMACVKKMDGRFFGGRRLEAYLHDGRTKYRKSKKHDESAKEEERLEKFGTWLEGHQDDKKDGADKP
jgi:HIV Tat-specific factor 1